MNEILNYNLLKIGDYNLTLSSIFFLIFFFITVFLGLRGIKKLIYRSTKFDAAKKFTVYTLIKYVVYIFSIISGFQILGFNPSVFLAGSAALLVGLGLGLQSLFSDYISGIILLLDSSVKVDDVIEINGIVCRVQEIGLRTTVVLTRDDKFIILPNSNLTKNHLINWTHNSNAARFKVLVGVDYGSDINYVMAVLKEVIDSQEGVLKSPSPFIRCMDFGESSVNFAVYFWAEDVFRVENIKGQIRIKIFEAFKKQGITIPFPQRVVHHKKNIEQCASDI